MGHHGQARWPPDGPTHAPNSPRGGICVPWGSRGGAGVLRPVASRHLTCLAGIAAAATVCTRRCSWAGPTTSAMPTAAGGVLVELGAGKGWLGAAAVRAAPGQKLVLVDRQAAFKNKVCRLCRPQPAVSDCRRPALAALSWRCPTAGALLLLPLPACMVGRVGRDASRCQGSAMQECMTRAQGEAGVRGCRRMGRDSCTDRPCCHLVGCRRTRACATWRRWSGSQPT